MHDAIENFVDPLKFSHILVVFTKLDGVLGFSMLREECGTLQKSKFVKQIM